jgi:hypothetical protein
MIFGSPEPDDELDEDERLAGEEAPTHLSLHHHVPLKFGGTTDDGLLVLKLPAVSIEDARTPVSPGLPPLFMPPLFHPDSLRLLPPPGVQAPSLKPSVLTAIAAERAAFPAAPTPDFVRSTPPSPPPARPADAMAATLRQAAVGPDVETPTRPSLGERIDPMVAFIFYLALGAGVALSGVDTLIRYTVLWTALIALGAALRLVDSPRPIGAMASDNLVWGFGIGFIVGLPFLVAVRPGLIAGASALYPDLGVVPMGFSLVVLFQSIVLVGPLGETLFFRGAIQDRRGIGASITTAGANNILFYLPLVLGGSGMLPGVAIFYLTALAGVYSFVRLRYGMTAALICQMTVNLMLLFVPGVIAAIMATRIP